MADTGAAPVATPCVLAHVCIMLALCTNARMGMGACTCACTESGADVEALTAETDDGSVLPSEGAEAAPSLEELVAAEARRACV